MVEGEHLPVPVPPEVGVSGGTAPPLMGMQLLPAVVGGCSLLQAVGKSCLVVVVG